MGQQSQHRHVIPITEPTTAVPEELRALVEKRVAKDRRVKNRRGGPPRRSLHETAREPPSEPAKQDISERRIKERRLASQRRAKAARRK
jgi:hypothetical protein